MALKRILKALEIIPQSHDKVRLELTWREAGGHRRETRMYRSYQEANAAAEAGLRAEAMIFGTASTEWEG